MTEQNLGKDFETLLGMLRPEESVNKEDIRILKEQIFGPSVFWVTGTRTTDDVLDRGIVVSQKQSPLTLGMVCCLRLQCPVKVLSGTFHPKNDMYLLAVCRLFVSHAGDFVCYMTILQSYLICRYDCDIDQVINKLQGGADAWPLCSQVRGNLRAPREQVFDTVLKGVKHHFGEKYQVFLVQDPDSEEEDPKGGPR